MARLILDREGGAFFDLKFSQREDGFGATAHLRVPKGAGRSSLILHEDFFWGMDGAECRSFVDGMDFKTSCATFLRNASSCFSFLQKPSSCVLFEVRCFAGGGEIAYRMKVNSKDLRSFRNKLERICESMTSEGGGN